MKVVVISNNSSRASFRQRIEIHLDTLKQNGIDTHVEKLPKGIFKRNALFRKALDYNAVFLHKKALNIVDAFHLREYANKIIYDFDDAIMFSPQKPHRHNRAHFNSFKRSVKIADLIIAGNEYLARQATQFNNNVEIIPTGLNIKEYRIQNPKPNDNKIRLVWIGSKSTLKYLTCIKPALEEVGRRFDNVVLRIICDDFFDLENMEVEKCRWSLSTQAYDLAMGAIGLSPLEDNRFTQGKCGFKILQYAAAGLVVVASPVGTNSEYVRDGVTGFLVTNIQQWVDRITQLVENLQLRKKMGQEARTQAKNFDVSIIGEQLTKLIKKCLHHQEQHGRYACIS